MFDRVGLARKFHKRLAELHAADPEGYTHQINPQPGRGHGIDYRPGVDWIAQHTRGPWPDKLVWTGKKLHERRRTRHYWLQVEGEVQADAVHIVAVADRGQNTIDMTAEQRDIVGDKGNPTHAGQGEVTQAVPLSGVTLRVLLHDRLLDLDRPVRVTCNGQVVFEGRVERDAAVQLRTLAGYGDPAMAASAEVLIPLD